MNSMTPAPSRRNVSSHLNSKRRRPVSFAILDRLIRTDRAAFHAEVTRLRAEDPNRLERYLARIAAQMTEEKLEEAKPLTKGEVDDALTATAKRLGWSVERVLSEAVLQLHAKVEEGQDFTPCTPDESPAPVTSEEARAMLLDS